MPDSPPTPDSLFAQGLAFHEKGDLDGAGALYRQALALNPKHFDAMHLSGVIAMQNGDNEQAVALISRALAIDPGNPAYGPAYNNRGIAYRALFRNEAAIDNFDRAIELGAAKPASLVDVHFNRANALKDLKRFKAAAAGYERVIALQPSHAQAHFARGRVLMKLGRANDAIINLRRAADLLPKDFQAQFRYAMALATVNRYEGAVDAFRRALAINPDHVASYNNLGVTLRGLRKYDASVACFEESLKRDAKNSAAYVNLAATLVEMGRHSEAVAAYDNALAIEPDCAFVKGLRLHSKMYICDWSNAAAEIAALVADIEAGKTVTPSWPVLALTDSLPVQRKAAETWVRAKHPLADEGEPVPATARREKIRIGYYSADFHEHATAYLAAGLFEAHDSTRFETVAFSFGPHSVDDMRRRLVDAFDVFIDVRQGTDREIASLSRERGIDIAVDLKGFTTGERASIFSHRAAPVQVSYLGYPGTMGAPYMDYIIADRTVIPESDFPHYCEKVVWLPFTYQVNDSKRRVAERIFGRRHVGLPEEGFVFCCFNNNFKITPEIFAVWMRILSRVSESVLWLLEDNVVAAANLRREAAACGIDPKRLIFARRLPAADHLSRQRVAGLLLDTPIYNAHTTASDALWVGLPVLTCPGRSFAARVAASVLRAAGLDELIAADLGDYEEKAVALASEPARLDALKKRLLAEPLKLPLFDTPLFTRHLEKAYTRMAERHWAGLAPEHIAIDPTRSN